jgi:hypothetical protein
MGLRDVVKNTVVAVQVAQAVISGMGYPPNLQKQLADWSNTEAYSWVRKALTESEIADRVKSKANSMR